VIHNGTNLSYGGWAAVGAGRLVWFSGGRHDDRSGSGAIDLGAHLLDLERMRVVDRVPDPRYRDVMAARADGTVFVGPGRRSANELPVARYSPAQQ